MLLEILAPSAEASISVVQFQYAFNNVQDACVTPKFSPLRLSIVDFMGVLLPGAVWGLLLLTTLRLWTWRPTAGVPTPLDVGLSLLGAASPDDLGKVKLGAVFYSGFFIFSLLMGYLVKSFSARPADWFAFRVQRVLSAKLRDTCRTARKERRANGVTGGRAAHLKEFHFPYEAEYREQAFFPSIARIVHERTGHSWRHLPGYQPFECCKKLLKVCAPALWEEAERREAESRFLVSLELASLYSTLLALLATVNAMLEAKGLAHSLEWLATSFLISVVLANSLWNRRHREVEAVYVFVLIADRLPAPGRNEQAEKNQGELDDEG